MIPHERSLVEKYKNRPFALLGINTDTDKDSYKRQAAEQKVTWRSAWTGGKDNPISAAFRVEGYPTLYLIDASGKIRKKWLGAPGPQLMESAIEELLVEAERR
jgi:hypothetical protein